MKAEDFVLSVIALNQTYNYKITNPRAGLNKQNFVDDIYASAPNQILEYAGITFNEQQRSERLNNALSDLIKKEFFCYWNNGDITWSWPDKPGKHYHTQIKPNLPEEQVNQLELYAKSLT